MRRAIILAALLVASCGPKSLELPADPVEKAATCGAVEAASQRSATHFEQELSLESVGKVLHFPMLAASSGGSFSSPTATAVQKRMAAIQNKVVDSKWQDVVPACRQAFPASKITEVELPGDAAEAKIGCDELADFLRSAIDAKPEYINELAEFRRFSQEIEGEVTAGIRARAGSQMAAQQEQRRKALATMANAGPPVAVMRQCLKRFG